MSTIIPPLVNKPLIHLTNITWAPTVCTSTTRTHSGARPPGREVGAERLRQPVLKWGLTSAFTSTWPRMLWGRPWDSSLLSSDTPSKCIKRKGQKATTWFYQQFCSSLTHTLSLSPSLPVSHVSLERKREKKKKVPSRISSSCRFC